VRRLTEWQSRSFVSAAATTTCELCGGPTLHGALAKLDAIPDDPAVSGPELSAPLLSWVLELRPEGRLGGEVALGFDRVTDAPIHGHRVFPGER